MVWGPAPHRFHYKVQIQTMDGWRQVVSCNSFEKSVRIADAVAESECAMTRVLDIIHDRIIVHERVGPRHEHLDDEWYDEPVFEEQVNWKKEGF